MFNLEADALGSALDLVAYNSGQELGSPGNEGVPVAPTGDSSPIKASLLNNTDFNLLHIVVTNATASPIVALPPTLVTNTYWTTNDVTSTRSIALTGGAGLDEFTFNHVAYTPTLLNHTINFNAVEQWNITGSDVFDHALHVHDIKFQHHCAQRRRAGLVQRPVRALRVRLEGLGLCPGGGIRQRHRQV